MIEGIDLIAMIVQIKERIVMMNIDRFTSSNNRFNFDIISTINEDCLFLRFGTSILLPCPRS